MARAAEAVAPGPARIAALLARELGWDAAVVHLERRVGCDLYRADGAHRSALVKAGAPARIAHEAANLRRASALVGDLAPALLGLVEPADGPSVLVMEYVPGTQVEPGRLTGAAWRSLVGGLLRLHGQGPGGPPACLPLAPDFVTLSFSQGRYASLPQLRPLLAAAAGGAPDLDARAALGLFDELVAEFEARRPLFTRPPRFVHADLWPENVLTRGGRCWLVDWTWLKPSDYALDLANLKLVLDWVWPPWRAQRAFEGLLRRYARALGDDSVPARMRVFSPLASLIKLVQFGEESPVEPYNADCMRAFLATARRDRALWTLPTAGRRLQYAVTHRPPSAYSVYNEPADLRSRAGRALARLVEAGWRTARRRLAGRSLARPAPPATGSRPGHGARA